MDDTISRRAAIRLITGYNGTVDKSVAKRLLLQLPSAQPEQQWIPCSERLPETPTRVLGQLDNGWMITVYRHNNQWLSVGDDYELDDDCFVAWMPLPEPYAERRTE